MLLYNVYLDLWPSGFLKVKLLHAKGKKPYNKQYQVNKNWNLNDTITLMCASYITVCKEVSMLVLSMLITLLNRTYRDRKSMWTSGPMFRSVLSGVSMCRMSVSKPVNRIQIKIVFSDRTVINSPHVFSLYTSLALQR